MAVELRENPSTETLAGRKGNGWAHQVWVDKELSSMHA